MLVVKHGIMKKKVSILIPTYNEERSLPVLYDALIKIVDKLDAYDWEVLFVNDGSSDTSLKQIKLLRQKDERICYVDLSRNFGKEAAMLAGFDYVTGDCTIVMDADLQDPPCLIESMLYYWEKGYDDVYAKRNDRGAESFLRRKFTLLFYSILQRSTRVEILPNVGDFRLLDKCCIRTLRGLRESERYTKGMFAWIGFKKKEICFDRNDRLVGHSSWSFFQLLGLAIDGITSFTIFPLRFATILGVILSLCVFIYMIYIFIKTLLYGDPVQGFPTLIIVVLFLGGIQLLSLGIIGEYLGRIFNEAKNRPVYIAREYNDVKL